MSDATTKKNVLLILVDQVLRSSLAAYGGTVCRTPALDTLAASGVIFDHAYTTISLCSPARASLFTGKLPHKHGILYNVTHHTYGRAELAEDEVVLSRLMREAGYACGYFGKWHIGMEKGATAYGFEGTRFPGFGLPSDFVADYDAFLKSHDHPGLESVTVRNLLGGADIPEAMLPLGRTLPNAARGAVYSGVIDLATELTPAGYVAAGTIDFMRAHRDEPFFAVASFWGPHHPALPSPEFDGTHARELIPEWGNFADELEEKPRIQKRYARRLHPKLTNAPWPIWRRIISAHYDFMAMIDAQIGRILQELETLGLADNTVVVFTSDHGDTLGCHGGQWDKGPYMYEETYAVPLILRLPDVIAGRAMHAMVSNMDLFPTILDACGLAIPDGLDAKSCLPVCEGRLDTARDCVTGQFFGFDVRGLFLQRMIRSEQYKYVYNPSDIDEFYDLNADPSELHNAIDEPKHKEAVERLKRRLLQEMRAANDPHAAFADELMGIET